MSYNDLLSVLNNMVSEDIKLNKPAVSIEDLDNYKDRLYHITTKEQLPKILEEGIKPMIGFNSKMAKEYDKKVYLTDYNSLPYWIILLGGDVVLAFNDIEYQDCTQHVYTNFSEFVYGDPIIPNRLFQVDCNIDTTECMRKMCLSMIEDISIVTRRFAEYYNDKRGKDIIYSTFMYNLSRLDYSVLTKEEIREELKLLGEDGEYTFCDTYLDTGRRMYQQLIYYKNDKFTKIRRQLYQYIITSFEGCLDVNTGGWTG